MLKKSLKPLKEPSATRMPVTKRHFSLEKDIVTLGYRWRYRHYTTKKKNIKKNLKAKKKETQKPQKQINSSVPCRIQKTNKQNSQVYLFQMLNELKPQVPLRKL